MINPGIMIIVISLGNNGPCKDLRRAHTKRRMLHDQARVVAIEFRDSRLCA
jgi:hypothetical protein